MTMPRSPLLQKAWTLFEQGQYEEALEIAHARLSGLQGEDRRDAQRLIGLARYHQRQYEKAVFWLTEACKGSDYAGDWLNLALAAIMDRKRELAEEAFEQAHLCQQAAKYDQEPGWYVQLYWYACALGDAGQWERVLPLLDELAAAYKRVHQSDAVLLYARGMPFLPSFLALAVRCFRALERQAEGIAWLEELSKALDASGQRLVGKAVGELRSEE